MGRSLYNDHSVMKALFTPRFGAFLSLVGGPESGPRSIRSSGCRCLSNGRLLRRRTLPPWAATPSDLPPRGSRISAIASRGCPTRQLGVYDALASGAAGASASASGSAVQPQPSARQRRHRPARDTFCTTKAAPHCGQGWNSGRSHDTKSRAPPSAPSVANSRLRKPLPQRTNCINCRLPCV